MAHRLNPKTVGRVFDDPARGRVLNLKPFAPWPRLGTLNIAQCEYPEAFEALRDWILSGQSPDPLPLEGQLLIECAAQGLLLPESSDWGAGLAPEWLPGARIVGELDELAGDLLRVGLAPREVEADAAFAKDAVVKLRTVLPSNEISAVSSWYATIFEGGWARPEEDGWRQVVHNDPVGRAIIDALKPSVERVVGEPLVSSYTYAVQYDEGHDLKRHVDRDQSVVSISMPISYTPAEPGRYPWPLLFFKDDKTLSMTCDIGEALLFSGRHLPHARTPLPEGHCARALFLHYVGEGFVQTLD